MNSRKPTIDEMFDSCERQALNVSQMRIPALGQRHRLTHHRLMLALDALITTLSLATLGYGLSALVSFNGDVGEKCAFLVATLLSGGCLVVGITMLIRHRRHPIGTMTMSETRNHVSKLRLCFLTACRLGLSGLVATFFLLTVPAWNGRSFCGDGDRYAIVSHLEGLLDGALRGELPNMKL